jgi:Major Facilitator Superfamily
MENFGGWRSIFYVYGISGLLVMIPWLLISSDSPQQQLNSTKSVFSQPLDVNERRTLGNFQDLLQVIHDAPWIDVITSKGAWACVLAHCSRNWGLYNTLAWTPSFYAEEYGIGVKESALLSILPCVAGAVGGFIAGFSADKMLRNQNHHHQHNGSLVLENADEEKTNIRKMFQSIALIGSAASLGVLALHIPEEAWLAQVCLTCSLGLLSFSAAGFDAAIQDKAATKWSGLLYSVTTLPAVLGTS